MHLRRNTVDVRGYVELMLAGPSDRVTTPMQPPPPALSSSSSSTPWPTYHSFVLGGSRLKESVSRAVPEAAWNRVRI